MYNSDSDRKNKRFFFSSGIVDTGDGGDSPLKKHVALLPSASDLSALVSDLAEKKYEYPTFPLFAPANAGHVRQPPRLIKAVEKGKPTSTLHSRESKFSGRESKQFGMPMMIYDMDEPDGKSALTPAHLRCVLS